MACVQGLGAALDLGPLVASVLAHCAASGLGHHAASVPTVQDHCVVVVQDLHVVVVRGHEASDPSCYVAFDWVLLAASGLAHCPFV